MRAAVGLSTGMSLSLVQEGAELVSINLVPLLTFTTPRSDPWDALYIEKHHPLNAINQKGCHQHQTL